MGFFDFFKTNKVNTAPENDTEKWILGTYAMWSTYYDGDWKYIAGCKKINIRSRSSMRTMLLRDWAVSDKKELFDMVNHLMQFFDIDTEAWDLCRACQILGMGFIADYITREEMVQHSLLVCHEMQKLFGSWDELYESYLKGFRDWKNDSGDGAEEAIRAREDICRKLKEAPDGPFTMPWQQRF